MLRVMLRAMSHDAARDAAHHAAHDVLQPLLPNLSCPLLKNSLVHICEQLGCARRLAILAAEVYFAYNFMYNFGLKSCEPRAMGTHFVHSYKVATLQLELRAHFA